MPREHARNPRPATKGGRGSASRHRLSSEINVVFNSDGSGSGEARMDILLPADLSGEGATDFSDIISGLSAEGWQEVKVEPVGSGQVRITGVYPFGDQPGEGALGNALPGLR